MDGNGGTPDPIHTCPEETPDAAQTSERPEETTPEGADHQASAGPEEKTVPEGVEASACPAGETPVRSVEAPAYPEETPAEKLVEAPASPEETLEGAQFSSTTTPTDQNQMGQWLSRWINFRQEDPSRSWGCPRPTRHRESDNSNDRGAGDEGLQVYDNVVTGDPSNVVFGRGNRAGGRVTGRVSGNRVLR